MAMRVVFDTNILIDYLCGVEAASLELGRYKQKAISCITWMEVMVGADGASERLALKSFLKGFSVIETNPDICGLAIVVRRDFKLKLPDAIIYATAKFYDAVLLTRDKIDFPNDEPDIRIPY